MTVHFIRIRPGTFWKYWLYFRLSSRPVKSESAGLSLGIGLFLFVCLAPWVIQVWNQACELCIRLSVQFNHSVVSSSLWIHGLQHARLPCPSLPPGACSNSCPSSQWCHPTISSFVVPFSSCLQSFPASGSFPMSQFFASGGQSIGVSASASVLPMNIQHCDGLVESPCCPRNS